MFLQITLIPGFLIFNVCLNRRHRNFHVFSCIQSIKISQVIASGKLLYSCERKRNNVAVILWKYVLISWTLWKGLGDQGGSLSYTLRSSSLEITWLHSLMANLIKYLLTFFEVMKRLFQETYLLTLAYLVFSSW